MGQKNGYSFLIPSPQPFTLRVKGDLSEEHPLSFMPVLWVLRERAREEGV
jgi:hypothetical protein